MFVCKIICIYVATRSNPDSFYAGRIANAHIAKPVLTAHQHVSPFPYGFHRVKRSLNGNAKRQKNHKWSTTG